MPSRSTKVHTSLSFQPVDPECRRLVGATVQLCRRVPKSERYPYTELVHQYVNAAGDRLYRLRHKEKLVNRMNSYLGILRHADAYNLRKKYCTMVLQSPWRDVLEVKGDYLYIAVRKPYMRRAYYTWKNKQLKRYVNDTQREDQAA